MIARDRTMRAKPYRSEPVNKRLAFLVLLALPGFLPPAARASNDPRWSQQYGPQQIGAPTAWSKAKGAGVRVAIIDSGVDIEHPDLKSKLVENCPGSNCYDYGDSDNNPDDDSNVRDGSGAPVRGHGTHVAGIAAAATDNGEGIAGVAPDAKIMPLKVFGDTGLITDSLAAVPNAVDFAVSHGAKVLNLSLGDFNIGGLVGPIQTACNTAYDRGALCIVSSGNSGGDNPSGYDRSFRALIVTANDDKGNHTSFGQKADTQWALSAPGQAIMSAVPVEDGSYGNKSGTSMAAPHAAGVAALLFGQGLTNRQVVDKMLSTATPMTDRGTNGAGIVNAAAAVGASAPPPGSSAATGGGVTGGAATGSKSGGKGSAASQPSAGGGASPTQPGGVPAPSGGDDFADALQGSGTSEVNGQATSSTKKSDPVSGETMTQGLAVLLLLGVALPTLGAWRRRAV